MSAMRKCQDCGVKTLPFRARCSSCVVRRKDSIEVAERVVLTLVRDFLEWRDRWLNEQDCDYGVECERRIAAIRDADNTLRQARSKK